MSFFSVSVLVSFLETAVFTRSPSLGRATHAHIIKSISAASLPPRLSNHLINMYSKLDRPDSAQRVLSLSSADSVVGWTSLVAGLVQNGHFLRAVTYFREMLRRCVAPNDYTFPCALKACGLLQWAETGRMIHGLIFKLGQMRDFFVSCGVFDMYSKLGLGNYACKVFDEMLERNSVIWSAYISNSVLCGRPLDAIQGFIEFLRAGVGEGPDHVTLCAFLNACSDLSSLLLGEQLHAHVIISGYEGDVSVANGLIDFYGKCERIGCSEKVFCGCIRNAVSWSSLIASYEQNDESEMAFMVFIRSRKEGVEPLDFMLSSVLSACAGIAILELGRSVHALTEKACVIGNVYVDSALVDMYCKCGCIEDAEQAFYGMPNQNVVSWNTLMGGYAHLGFAPKALALYDEMMLGNYDVEPNHVTFVCVLSACSRARWVKIGMEIFKSIRRLGFEIRAEHYACVVDMLGRAGMVEQAFDLVKIMPMAPTISIWGALLGACKAYGNTELGKIAAEELFKLDLKDCGNHILLSNTFAASGRWEEATSIRKVMTRFGIKKGTGFSWIFVKSQVHAFRAKDTSHQRNSEIQAMLTKLMKSVKVFGYVPRTEVALYDLEEEERESEVWCHSEKIALAYGLIALPPFVPIRIMKNLRVCLDCHDVFKVVARMTSREIVVRDNSQFHWFRDGQCSCGDYW